MSDENDDKTVIANVANISMEKEKKANGIPSLVQYNGDTLGKRYPILDLEINIGRSADANLTITESSVSRLHAKLTNNGDIVEIEDLGSANGTYINDIKIGGRSVLKDGDMIRLGAVMLKFFSKENIDGYIQDKIYRMATIDVGTGIFNKQYLLDSLDMECKMSQTSGRPLSIIYYDLDHFKKVNDTYGHNAGDQILKEGAEVTKKVLRKEDIQCRYGGEEFVIILPNTNIQEAYDLAERVRLAMQNHIFNLNYNAQGENKQVAHTQTISGGVSQLTPTMTSPKELLENADQKLYTSKQTGRNRFTI